MIKINNNFISSVYDETTVIGKIYKGTLKVYKAWTEVFTMGVPPLKINSNGEDLTGYTIYGNCMQNGIPTLETPVEVEGVGDKTKNLLDEAKLSGLYSYGADETKTVIRTSTTNKGIIVPCKPNTTYTIKQTKKTSRFRVFYYDTEVVLNSTKSNGGWWNEALTQNTFTTGENTKYLGISLGKNEEMVDNNVWLYEGDTDEEYEPYGYRISIKITNETEEINTNIYTNEPLRKIDFYSDVLDYNAQHINRPIHEYVVTGAESGWTDRELSYNLYGIVFRNQNLVPYDAIDDIATSNYFSYGSISNNNEKAVFSKGSKTKDFQFKIIDGQLGISKDDDPAVRLEKWLNWLKTNYKNGTPLKIQYVLKTPMEEKIDLPNIPTIKGTTIIEVDTKIQPTNMAVVYKKNRKASTNNISNLENTLVSDFETKIVKEVEL